MLEERRGLLAEKDHKKFEKMCDMMKDYEEKCLQKILWDLYRKI